MRWERWCCCAAVGSQNDLGYLDDPQNIKDEVNFF